MGKRFLTPKARLSKLLARKDEVQHGSRAGRSQEAELMLKILDEFGVWAKQMLADGSVTLGCAATYWGSHRPSLLNDRCGAVQR